MVALQAVTRDLVIPLSRLSLSADQAEFVPSNEMSLAQAPYETGCHPFAIVDEDRVVGFLSVLNNRQHDFLGPDDDPQGAYLWRLMIDRDHQRRGYGSLAMQALEAWAQSRGLCSVTLTVHARNAGAMKFYFSLGYAKTGRNWDHEVEFVKPLLA